MFVRIFIAIKDIIGLFSCFMLYLDTKQMLYEAVRQVLGDESFNIPSPTAADCLEMASSFLAHCDDSESMRAFSHQLVKSLKSCFIAVRSRKLAKENMWGLYHVLRSSAEFKDAWIEFTEAATGMVPPPAFYQHVTHTIFKKLIQLHYPVTVKSSSIPTALTREEENALRYVCGYVCRKLRIQLESSSRRNKDDLILFIMDMSGDECDEDRGTEDWINSIDRGGLWHVSDLTYDLFYSMEEVLRRHFKPGGASRLKEGSVKVMQDAVIEDEDVLCLLTCSSGDTEFKEFLEMIIKLYITIRGFSFANSCMEEYKKASKKLLDKGKGIRKQLFTSTAPTINE